MSNLAAKFREFHFQDDLLILPNAWDAASVRAIENAGANVITTSSAEVAWALGYPDGDKNADESATHNASLLHCVLKRA